MHTLLLALVLAGDLPVPAFKFQTYQLKNGLSVNLQEDLSVPVASPPTWAQSAQDRRSSSTCSMVRFDRRAYLLPVLVAEADHRPLLHLEHAGPRAR